MTNKPENLCTSPERVQKNPIAELIREAAETMEDYLTAIDPGELVSDLLDAAAELERQEPLPTEHMVVAGFEAVSAFQDGPIYAEMSGCRGAAESARICWAAMVEAMPPGEVPRQDVPPTDAALLALWSESHFVYPDRDKSGFLEFARAVLSRYGAAIAIPEGYRQVDVEPAFLAVSTVVRYWEDATVNGEDDGDGLLMPCVDGDKWEPVISLNDGQIHNWPAGTIASIHYKVCDEGEYWLLNSAGEKIAKWKSDYVPDDLLCIGQSGYGDYIIMEVGPDGKIIGWEIPEINPEQWEAIDTARSEGKL